MGAAAALRQPSSTSSRISPAARREIAGGARAEKARRRFAVFFRQGWSVIEGSTHLEWNVYIEALCDHLQALFYGWLAAEGKANARQRAEVAAHWKRWGLTPRKGRLLVQNMIVNMPPGTLKSRILMVFFPAWIWLHAPGFTFACSSSNDENVQRDSEMHQQLVSSDWYVSTFGIPWSVKTRTASVKRWSTTAGGKRISRTILSGFIGLHVDGIFVDDPDEPLRVFNEPERKRTHNKWTKAIENRVNHELRSLRIIAQQRVHPEDLTGYLLKQSRWSKSNRAGWMRLCVPMQAGKAPPDLERMTAFGWSDPRKKPAANDNRPPELMTPTRHPPSVMADKRRKHGTHGYESLYNQNPEALGGGWIERSWFRFFRVERADGQALPPPRARPDGCNQTDPAILLTRNERGKLDLDFLTITVDATFGSQDEKKASAVGMLVFGGKGVSRYIFHDATNVMTFNRTEEVIKSLVRAYGARRVLIELKANGPGIIDRLQKAMREGELLGPDGKAITVTIVGYDPGKNSKPARARMMIPDIEAGVVFLLEGAAWLEEFLKEVCVFPNSPRDDRIDALGQAMHHHGSDMDDLNRALAISRW